MGCVSRQPIIKGFFARGLFLAALVLGPVFGSAAGAAAQADGAAKRLLVLGDSLSAGYGLSAADAFPAQLERALKARGYNIKVINSGISGDTTKGGLQRLPWVLASKPRFVIVELGANDGLRGLDPRQTRVNLEGIITGLKAKGIKVLLTGMLAPPNLGPDYGKAFNGAYSELAAKHGLIFMPFFLKDVAMRPRLNQRDRIHPTRQGVAIIVRNIMPYVVKLLGPARS
jgi:acyl-CoA thioesterase-1